MTLLDTQQKLELDILYKTSLVGAESYNQINPNIFIKDGAVDIYGSNSEEKPASISEMILEIQDTNKTGLEAFDIVPRYIAIKQNTGTTTEIIVTGVIGIDQGGV